MLQLVTSLAHKFNQCLSRLLRDELHWLNVPERVQYKLAVTVHRCLQDEAPKYLVDQCLPVSDVAMQSTASEICQSTLPYRSAVSTKHVRPSGLRCWVSDGLELITWTISVIHRSAAVA